MKQSYDIVHRLKIWFEVQTFGKKCMVRIFQKRNVEYHRETTVVCQGLKCVLGSGNTSPHEQENMHHSANSKGSYQLLSISLAEILCSNLQWVASSSWRNFCNSINFRRLSSGDYKLRQRHTIQWYPITVSCHGDW